jgi:hypothetical protein
LADYHKVGTVVTKHILTSAEVDALFSNDYTRVVVEKCDNCKLPIENDDALTFGRDPFEMPVNVNGELAREIAILARRNPDRHWVQLCYPCIDALQEPVCGMRKSKLILQERSANVADDEMPRLFAV